MILADVSPPTSDQDTDRGAAQLRILAGSKDLLKLGRGCLIAEGNSA
jgi:hypothetical protein